MALDIGIGLLLARSNRRFEPEIGDLNMNPSYRELYFGESDSVNELANEPADFVRSFVDLKQTIPTVISGRRTFVLGPKGTGKSALGWYLQATSIGSTHLAKVRDASALPLAAIPELKTGQTAGVERTVTAWRFILLCNYLDLLLTDTNIQLTEEQEVRRVVRYLRGFGFMGDEAGKALLQVSSASVEIPIDRRGATYRTERHNTLNIYSMVPYLEDWAIRAQSPRRHILLLDGLDSIYLNDAKYDESLASLTQATYTLNQKLRLNQASGSIVLLLRNDVFNRISLRLPDAQKMRDDAGIELDWRVLSGAAGANAPLMRLVNRKAGQELGVGEIDVLSYFPRDIELGPQGKHPTWVKTLQYLLNLTRHTPRDMLRLFEEIRQVEATDMWPSKGRILDGRTIREGVLQYCTKYFTGAIRNEFVGYSGGPEEAAVALSALQSLGSSEFLRSDFRKAIEEVGPDIAHKADSLLRLLFFAGAIGNRVGNKADSYLQFYHRRDDTEVYLKGVLTLHNALVYAWSLPFAPARGRNG